MQFDRCRRVGLGQRIDGVRVDLGVGVASRPLPLLRSHGSARLGQIDRFEAAKPVGWSGPWEDPIDGKRRVIKSDRNVVPLIGQIGGGQGGDCQASVFAGRIVTAGQQGL